MLGTRSTAFPRLNAFSYCMYLFGGLLLWVAFVAQHRAGHRLVRLHAAVGPAILARQARRHLGADDHLHRSRRARRRGRARRDHPQARARPGMTLARMPLFVWAMLVIALMVIFSMPSVALASGMLLSDRLVGTQFYNPANMATRCCGSTCSGSSAIPEVYIIFLPATGFVSVITETFCRRPVFGYPVVVLALISTGILAFGLWVHHMFATGLPRVGYSFYTAASMSVAIPTGLQIFCWMATMWDGRPRFAGADALRRRLHRHLRHRRPDRRHHRRRPARPAAPRHLLHRRAFPLRADRRRGLPAARRHHLLVPEDHRPDDVRDARQDRLLDDLPRLPARLLPDALAGLLGMPRRVYTYPAGLGLELPNLLSTHRRVRRRAPRSCCSSINGILSLYRGAIAPSQPVGRGDARMGDELAARRPYNFAHMPVVESRTPLWDAGRDCRSSPAFGSMRRKCC